MAVYRSSSSKSAYRWQDCDDFQIPDDSVWFGKDDDGSDIFCGKAFDDGQEVPAKIIPERRECRVRGDNGDKVVTNCRKVLICRRSGGDDCGRRRNHCRRRRDHCRCDDDWSCSSSSESEDESSSQSKTTSSSANESRLFIKSVRSRSNSTTVTVKKNNKKKTRKCNRKSRTQCWDEQRTRVVPKVTYEPRVRYEPKVTMERRVRYEPETYVTRVCGERSCGERSCCEPCRDRCESRESSVDSCRQDRRCREALICERSPQVTVEEERCIRPDRCDSPPKSKGRCW